jgi:hypothetical protein
MSRLAWLAVGCAALVVPLQRAIDSRLGVFRAQEEILYVWSGEHLRRMLPGFEDVMADVYWLRTVQYYGGQRTSAGSKRYDLLEPLTEVTVSLDPHFEIAYRYGATFLAEPYPLGAGHGEAAVALLQRGVDQNPDAWLLWQHLGLFKFFFLKDAHGAAETFMAAARRPGAPIWMEAMAALVLRKSGDRASARAVWQSVYDHSEEGPIKETARINIGRLDAADAADALTRVVARFRERSGRNPSGWQELIAAGLLRGIPADASGVPFEYNPARGTVAVGRRSVLYMVS